MLDGSGAQPQLHRLFEGLDALDVVELARRAQQAPDVVWQAVWPDALTHEVLQARPETVASRRPSGRLRTFRLQGTGEVPVDAGVLPFSREDVDVQSLPRPRTRVMLNIGDPDQAFEAAALPSDGVGLARTEFIVARHVRAHPMALVQRVASDGDERDPELVQDLVAMGIDAISVTADTVLAVTRSVVDAESSCGTASMPVPASGACA